jgi:hypothetical protein
MKKIFTLIAVAAMALSANAQSISFTETADKGTLDGKTFGTGLVLTVTDTGSKMAIDGNNQYFGTVEDWTKYGYRLKSGGKSDSKLGFTLTVPADGTLVLHMRSSSSADKRAVKLMNGETEVASFEVSDENFTKGTVEDIADKTVWTSYTTAVTAGTYTFSFDGGLNIYGIILNTGSGIQTVKAAKNADAATYNLAGQKVDNNFKGVVIKNGQKVLNK